jgi:anti-sigma B factor antagonist
MVITEQRQNDIDIIILSGRFVMANAQEVKERLDSLIAQSKSKILIDMEKVTFIDSSAFAVLVSIYKELHSKSGHLVLVTSPVVQSLLELTRLQTIFEIMPNQTVALETLAKK